MNGRELKAQLIRKGISADQICTALGISRSAWFRKMRGLSQFTVGEIVGLRRELDLDDALTIFIFFDDDVSERTQLRPFRAAERGILPRTAPGRETAQRLTDSLVRKLKQASEETRYEEVVPDEDG